MKLKTRFPTLSIASVVLVALLLVQPGSIRAQEAVGTAFTYQGQLSDGGGPVTDTCDFQFGLWDALSDGSQIGSTQTVPSTTVTDGLFTVQLDFGSSAFTGDARWLEIAVRRPAGSGDYTALSPRQPLTPVPYAIFASAAPWSGLIGVPAGFADGTDDDTTYTGGSGLDLSGTEFSVDSGGITTTMLADASVTSAKLVATVTTITSDTALDASHQGVVLVSGNVTVTLPAASAVAGGTYTVKNIDAITKTVTIAGTVDGQSNPQLNTPYAFITVVSDGSNWYKVAENVLFSGNSASALPIILYSAGDTYDGNLGGRSGADSMCVNSSNKPDGYSNFIAFLSVSADDEIRDMPTLYSVPTDVPIQSVGGTRVANDWFDLLDGNIAFDLYEALGITGSWFSGSNWNGSVHTDYTCAGWTVNTSIDYSQLGRSDATDTNWMSGSTLACKYPFRVLCIAY